MTEDGPLDALLQQHGYTIPTKADIMSMEIAQTQDVPEVICLYQMQETWLDGFVVLNGTTVEKETAKETLRCIGRPVCCAAVYQNGEMAGCGLGVYEDGKIGLYDVRVLEKYRRKGIGTQLCKKIIAEGKNMGAQETYLQVASDNFGAIAMYQQLGYQKKYTYWYRVNDICG